MECGVLLYSCVKEITFICLCNVGCLFEQYKNGQ